MISLSIAAPLYIIILDIVYTLATAATLTAGDLPVYVVSKQPDLVAA